MKRVFLTLLLIGATACASKPAVAPAAPDWDAVPPLVVEALCRRLQMDAIATGPLTIVRTTQPLATPDTMTAVAGASGKRRGGAAPVAVPITNREIPVSTAGGSCRWNAIDAAQVDRHSDEMVVALSAPIANPWAPGEAGLLARVSLGQETSSWYWVPLVPSGSGWSVRMVSVLFR